MFSDVHFTGEAFKQHLIELGKVDLVERAVIAVMQVSYTQVSVYLVILLVLSTINGDDCKYQCRLNGIEGIKAHLYIPTPLTCCYAGKGICLKIFLKPSFLVLDHPVPLNYFLDSSMSVIPGADHMSHDTLHRREAHLTLSHPMPPYGVIMHGDGLSISLWEFIWGD